MSFELDHVGIVVDDIREAQEFVEETLGLTCSRELRDHGSVSTVFYAAGSVLLEFIELHDAAERESRLGQYPATIEHLAFKVSNADASADELAGRDIRFTDNSPRVTGGARSYFTDAESTDGVIYQFFERATTDHDSQQYQIVRPAFSEWQARENGLRTIYITQVSLGAQSFLNGLTRIPVGGALPVHRHNCDESVTIIDGSAMVEVEGQREIVKPLDTVFIKAGVDHRFANASGDPLVIHWTYGSIHATREIVETGQVTSVEDENAASRGE